MAEMKPSNAEWLGDIPEDWNVARIGDFYKLRNEKVSDEDFAPLSVTMKGIVPQLATAAKTDDHNNRKLVRKGDFAINSRSDRRGSCGISPYDGSVSLINTILTPRGEMNPDYYNWLFHTEQFADEFYKWGHGIVDDLWTTRWQEMKSIMIVSPPLDEQQSIAIYLDDRCSKIDTIIAEAKASIEEYKELKQAVIYEAVTKGLNKNVEMKDSGVEWIENIPSHWNLVKTNRIIDNTQNGLTRRDLDKSYGQIVLKLKNINAEGEIDYSDTNRIQLTNDEIEKYRLHNGDLLFVRVNGSRDLVGKCAIFEEKNETVAYNDHIIRVTLNDYCIPEYVKWYLLCDSGKAEIALKINTAAGQFTISGEGLRAIYMPLPSLNEQRNIVEFLNNQTKKFDFVISEKQSLIEDLESYKKSLIYEVVTGKRKVVE